MAQSDLTIQNQSFPSFRADLNDALTALNSMQSGTSRPASAVAGTMWLDTTNATNPTIKFFDGTDDIQFATVNYSANTIDFLDSSLSTPITVTGSSSAGAEIRLPEDTDNGTNYVALKAPDSIASNVTLTLPSADGTADQILKTDGSGNLSFADASGGGLSWQSVQTTGFTASAGNAYPCDTSYDGFTVTLPAIPSAGDQVQLVDYAGTFDIDALTIDPNGEDIEGGTDNLQLTGEREGVILTYIDSTQGWIATSGINEGTDALSPVTYSVDFLVVAGGGGGGARSGSGGGAGGYRTSTQSVTAGTVITVTVGDGGSGGTAPDGLGSQGSSSSISGSGLTTITSAGGGGGTAQFTISGGNGGSGAGGYEGSTIGSGNTPSTSPSQGNNGGTGSASPPHYGSGGGGGASQVGANGTSSASGNGGDGTQSSITGSSVYYAGGGAGGIYSASGGGTSGTGGLGGGASTPTIAETSGNNGTANTGGGGSGGRETEPYNQNGGGGGKGIVILSMPLANFSSTVTGSPTESDDGTTKVLVFNGSGSYTT
jgi:hypothetical protein